jgi:integrase
VKELADKWVELKRMEISTNTMSRYESIIKNMLPAWGKLVSAVTTEDLLFIRKDLLTGYQVMKKGLHRLRKSAFRKQLHDSYVWNFSVCAG